VPAIIQGYGYPCETHFALTSDGYELTMYRIPRGRSGKSGKGPVLLQHGLTDSAAGWCLNSPSESLSYILADAGYDVWLGNNRGNGYSMNNVNFGPSDPRFWAFSWDEMALYDFPTQIQYVQNSTGRAKIPYIGHSEGTIQAFAGLSHTPSLGDSLTVYIALAPVAYVGGITVEVMQVLARLDADEILELLGEKEFLLPALIHKILPELCKFVPSECSWGGAYFYGADSYLNSSRLDYYTIYEPFPTSVQNIAHWAQGVRTDTFQMFDFGHAGNIKKYGQPTPPVYDLNKFPKNLPTALFTGGIDALADPTDVARLRQILNDPIEFVYNRPDYGHLDPLVGDDNEKLIYPLILSLLAKYAQ